MFDEISVESKIVDCVAVGANPAGLREQLNQLNEQTGGAVAEALADEAFPVLELALAAAIWGDFRRVMEMHARFQQPWRDVTAGQFGLVTHVKFDSLGRPLFSVHNMWPRFRKSGDSLGCIYSNFMNKRFRRRLKKLITPSVA